MVASPDRSLDVQIQSPGRGSPSKTGCQEDLTTIHAFVFPSESSTRSSPSQMLLCEKHKHGTREAPGENLTELGSQPTRTHHSQQPKRQPPARLPARRWRVPLLRRLVPSPPPVRLKELECDAPECDVCRIGDVEKIDRWPMRCHER